MVQKIYTILGATGHIGHQIAEDLLKRGYTVRAVGREERKLSLLKMKGAVPCQVELTDQAGLVNVFKDAFAVFTLLPPNLKEKDYAAYQDRVGTCIIAALQEADVKRVVNLSSVGAELSEGTGVIAGLHRQEERLNALKTVDLLIHLRPGYFMENLINFLPLIPQGVIRSCLSSDLKIPMIATRDIGWKAAVCLDNTAPQLRQIFDFVGPKEVSLNDVAHVFGKVFDIPDLHCEQISYIEESKMLVANGLSPATASLIVEMDKAFNEGLIRPTQELTRDHKGTTTLETFADMIAPHIHLFAKAA